jgi:hypothetical protein
MVPDPITAALSIPIAGLVRKAVCGRLDAKRRIA